MIPTLPRLASGLFLAGALVCPAAANEFLLYPPCQVGVDGTLRAVASVATGATTCLDTETCDYDRVVPLATTGVAFRGACRASANVTKSFFDGCQTDAVADVEGRAGYTFVADDDSIAFEFEGANTQEDSVLRGPLGVGPGNPVFARTVFDLAGHNQFILASPFMVGGGDGASLQASFGLKRSDSGPSTGQVLGSWTIYSDLNGNCRIDPNEPIVASDSGQIGPNQSFTAPTMTFPTPRGNYILVIGHQFADALAGDSMSCADPVAVRSAIEHKMSVRFDIVTACP